MTDCGPGAAPRRSGEPSYDQCVKSRRVVVSGVPGSGKSTLGREVASRLNLAFLDKDDFLDALFDSEPITETRSALSRLADDQFVSEALATDGAVVVSFWRRPELSHGSGTPTAWLEQSDDLVEVFCDCPPLVAVRRFEARRRHVRHDDETRSTKDLLDQFTALAALGPIGLGSLVRVDTAAHVDVDAVTAAIEDKLPDIRAR